MDPMWKLAGARFDVRFAMGPNGAGQNTPGGPQGPVAIWRCRGFPIHCQSQDAGRPLLCRSIMVHCPPSLGSFAVNCGRFPLRSGTLPLRFGNTGLLCRPFPMNCCECAGAFMY